MRWKDIPGYKGLYQVSSYGYVRSVDRVDALGRPKKGKELLNSINRYGYPTVSLHNRGQTKNCTVHRLVASAFLREYSELLQVDHKDGERKNNQLNNLRMSSQTSNNGNARKLRESSSKYKGVYWHKRDKRWVSRIAKNGVYHTCGRFEDEYLAALAYDKKAIELYGEFAMTNERLSLL